MNRKLAALLCAMIAFLFTFGAFAEEETTYCIASVPEQNFSTLYDYNFDIEWSEKNGLTIYTDGVGHIPYLLVYREMNSELDPERYINEVLTSEMKEQYGENLIEIGEVGEWTISGKAMTGIKYVYVLAEAQTTIEFLRFIEPLEDSFVIYTAKYIQGQSDDTMQALVEAAAYFQPDANFYAQDDQYCVASVPEQNFSTKYDSSFSSEWSENDGLTIYTDEHGYIPFLLVYRGMNPNLDPEKYLNEVYTPEMQQKYGENLIEIGEVSEYTVSGKPMIGIRYAYVLPETQSTIELFRVFEMLEDSYVMYTAKYVQGEGDNTMQALVEAAAYFQPDANFYMQ